MTTPRFLFFGAMLEAGHYPWPWDADLADEVALALGAPDRPPGTGQRFYWFDGRETSGRLKARNPHPYWDADGHVRDHGVPLTDREPQGQGVLYRRGGWSAIHFWDRGADNRGACQSWFCVEGDWTAAEIIEHARGRLPARYWEMRPGFTFDIQEPE